MIICIGPCCVPVGALLPFLIGLAHKYGYLKWVNPNWFSYRWVKYKYKQWRNKKQVPMAASGECCSGVQADGTKTE